jgi:hypothetical protein
MQVLTEEKLVKSAAGINIPLTNPLGILQRRPGFKVSSLKIALFPKRNFNI